MGARKIVREKDGSEGGILFALEYLVSEAKRENSKRLLLILESALTLAKNNRTKDYLENSISNDDDTLNATYFLLRFLQAPNEVQKKALEIIENTNL
ncbi:MAG TPA: hypothetical protein DEA55_09915 [Rhodospirillaceae bacterium]|nr:hypothetical protein [Rhodospirillaceae bacterium]